MTAKTRAQLNAYADLVYADNTTRAIDEEDVRQGFKDMADSMLAPEDTVYLIDALEAFAEFTSAGDIAAAALAGIANLYVNKTVGGATQVTVPLSTGRDGLPLEIKDKKQDAATNNITVVFTGGQMADGLSSIVISTNGGWLRMKPDGTGWNIMGYQI